MSRTPKRNSRSNLFFAADLYDPEAVEWAVAQMGRSASVHLRKARGGMEVTIMQAEADGPSAAGELANLALARTMERRS